MTNLTNYDVYPMPEQTNGLLDFFQYVNSVSDGYFFSGMLFVFWFIIVITGARISSASKSFTFASFFMMIISIILGTLNLIAPKIMYIFIIGTAIGAIWMKLED